MLNSFQHIKTERKTDMARTMNSANSNMNEQITNAVREIKSAILKSQYQTAKIANKNQLSLYFGIGRYVSQNSREGFWGTGAIETISKNLQTELPGLRGFSAENIKKMRRFYEEWNPVLFRSPVATNLPKEQNAGDSIQENTLIAVSQKVEQMDIEEFPFYNPDFNCTEFGTIKNQAGSNNFVLSVKTWISIAQQLVGQIAKRRFWNKCGITAILQNV